MTERNSGSIGGIGRRQTFRQTEKGLDHLTDLVLAGRGSPPNLIAQFDDHRVQAQLQYRVHLPPGIPLHLRQAIDVPGIEHQRLLADGVGAGAQGEAHVRVVRAFPVRAAA